jgi:UV DNA damage endonuclease
LGVRATYDIHHQRCHELSYDADGVPEEYFEWAKETWKDYDYQRMHISTPRDGYTTASKSRPHHDYIDINDLPSWMIGKENLHVDIEAKAKEVAIKKLRNEIIQLSI